MNECLYCDKIYDTEDYSTCPNCAVSIDTKGITVIQFKEDEE